MLPAHDGMHPRHQALDRKWLADISIPADLISFDLLWFIGRAGQKDDRRPFIFSDLPAQVKTISILEKDIDQIQIEASRLDQLPRSVI